jgi:hypothetical protein
MSDLRTYKVAIVGSIPVRTESGENKLPFRIEGKDRHSGDTLQHLRQCRTRRPLTDQNNLRVFT